MTALHDLYLGTSLFNYIIKSKIFGACKKKLIICNFDPTFRGRYEVQKNKWTPYCLTEFHGESEKNDRFVPRELLFWTKYGS